MSTSLSLSASISHKMSPERKTKEQDTKQLVSLWHLKWQTTVYEEASLTPGYCLMSNQLPSEHSWATANAVAFCALPTMQPQEESAFHHSCSTLPCLYSHFIAQLQRAGWNGKGILTHATLTSPTRGSHPLPETVRQTHSTGPAQRNGTQATPPFFSSSKISFHRTCQQCWKGSNYTNDFCPFRFQPWPSSVGRFGHSG